MRGFNGLYLWLLPTLVAGRIDRYIADRVGVHEADNSRQKIVSQYNVVRTTLIDNETTPLQVGNGDFAFNVDNTGMQVDCHIAYLSTQC